MFKFFGYYLGCVVNVILAIRKNTNRPSWNIVLDIFVGDGCICCLICITKKAT